MRNRDGRRQREPASGESGHTFGQRPPTERAFEGSTGESTSTFDYGAMAGFRTRRWKSNGINGGGGGWLLRCAPRAREDGTKWLDGKMGGEGLAVWRTNRGAGRRWTTGQPLGRSHGGLAGVIVESFWSPRSEYGRRPTGYERSTAGFCAASRDLSCTSLSPALTHSAGGAAQKPLARLLAFH